MRKHGIIWIGMAGMLVAGIGAAAYMRSGPDKAKSDREKRIETVRGWISDGQKEYRTVSYSPFATLNSVTAVRANLDSATIDGSPSPDSGSTSALLDAASEFLYYRYASESVDAYLKWRTDRGYSFVEFETLKTVQYVHKIYEFVCKESLPTDATCESAFRGAWAGCAAFDKGRSKALGIAKEPKGLAVVFGELTSTNPNERRPLRGELPWELWRGGVGGTHPNWFESGPSKKDLLQKYGRIQYADVGVLIEFPDNVRVPINLTYFWDPTTRRWRLEYFNSYNYPGDHPPAMVF